MIRKLVRQMLTAQILSALTVSLCLLIDSIMIGRFLGDGALTAYGLANPVLLVIGAVGTMLCAGAQVACSKSLGRGDQEETNIGYSSTIATGGIPRVRALVLATFWLLATIDACMAFLTNLEDGNHFKILIQKVGHQHADGKPDGVGMPGGEPSRYVFQQPLTVLFKGLRRKLVTGCPVVHIRKESAGLFEARLKVAHLGEYERVQLVLVKAAVRKLRQKGGVIPCPVQLLRQAAQCGRSNPDHRFRRDVGDQLDLKVAVFFVAKLKQRFADFSRRHAFPALS